MSNASPMEDTNIWVDGCFDLGHFGHANLLRQAKLVGGKNSKLIVGVHTDAEVEKNKRPPIFNETERCQMLEGTKWVDQVVLGAPYVTTPETVEENGCKFCVHGNDISVSNDGKDTYRSVKLAGIYKEVPRTQGISTTKLIKNVLNLEAQGPYTGSDFLLSSRRIQEFTTSKSPSPNARIIYTQGIFDLYHPGHVAFLSQAKKHGDYLIVGIYDDRLAQKLKNGKHPFMNLHERALTILGSKFVDEVIFGVPEEITEEFMEYFNVDLVVQGIGFVETDPFMVAIEKEKFLKIDSQSTLTTDDIVERIKNREQELIRSSKQKETQEKLVEAELSSLLV